MDKIEIIKGDITKQETDAIVNAANPQLAPGGGVSGAIHRAAGPQLWEECRLLGGCKTGEAKITKGYNLKAKYVIHTVGPVYRGKEQDRVDLAACFANSLKLASEKGLKRVSFPGISTGIFGYPVKEAAEVSLKAIKKFLENDKNIELVKMVLFGAEDYNIWKSKLESS